MTTCDMRAWSHNTRDDIVRCWTHKVMLYGCDTREGYCPAGYYEKLYEVAKRDRDSARDAVHSVAVDRADKVRELQDALEEEQGAMLADATLRIAASFALIDLAHQEHRGGATISEAADLAEDWYDESAKRGWLPARDVTE